MRAIVKSVDNVILAEFVNVTDYEVHGEMVKLETEAPKTVKFFSLENCWIDIFLDESVPVQPQGQPLPPPPPAPTSENTEEPKV
jgi:hypothetical protein